MPRSSALFTPRPVSGDDLVAAAQAVWSSTGDPDAGPLEWRSFDDGAVLQALAGDDVLVSILRPRVLPRPDEVARLWPDADVSGLPMPGFWTEAVTPWSAGGRVGVAVLDALVAAVGGTVVHDGLGGRLPEDGQSRG
jgi:hypothetical protein